MWGPDAPADSSPVLAHNCLIIDDPHSEQEAALAEINPEIYDKTYEWYTSGPRQRLQPGGAIVVVQTRWSKKDLTGRVLKAAALRGGDEWEVIEFPAILPSGNPLWPEFWPMEELLALKEELPNSKWMAQYQQNPTSEVSAIVKREWWQVWDKEDPPPCEFILMAWDTAFEANQRADYSAVTTWGVFYMNDANGMPQANIILLNAFRERMEFPTLKRTAIEHYKEWEPDSVIIEKKASGAPLIYEMRAMGIPVQEFTPTRGNDKISRLNAVSDLFASGRVWVPDTAWAEEVVEEVASFPAGDHDDYCFVAGTKVATPAGDVNIEELRVGDVVLTPVGARRVTAAGFTGVRPVISRAGLVGTANHPVYTLDKGWVPMDTVTLASTISRATLCSLIRLILRSVWSSTESFTDSWAPENTTCPSPAPLADVKERKGFMWRFGNIMQGSKFRQSMRSTIKTVIPLIAGLRTLSAYRAIYIGVCLEEYLTAMLWKRISRAFAPWRLFGTSQKKAVNGIDRTLSTRLRLPAWLKMPSHQSPAPIAVGAAHLPSEKTRGESFAARIVPSAIARTGGVNSEPPTHIMRPVYNLTVEGAHCYYANGVLVHNCDTVSMALMRFRKGGYVGTNLDEPDEPVYFKSKRNQGYY